MFEVLVAPAASSHEKTEALGMVSDLMQDSQCLIHPRALLSIFGDELQTVRSWTVGMTKESKSLTAIADTSAPPHGAHGWNCEVYLAAPEQIARRLQCQTHVDPAWIDETLLKKWKTACDIRHHGHIEQAGQIWRSTSGPNYVIDTFNECLIEVERPVSYVSLSYVWGPDMFFHTTRHNLAGLLKPHAFAPETNNPVLPQTIRNAMEVVKIIEERYLWVDALCIPQDDEAVKHKEISNMAAISANASCTIVAAQGSNASVGLRGLRGISDPRNLVLESVPFLFGSSIVQYEDPNPASSNSPWTRRGWTFQERVLSRRMLVFNRDTVYWQCPETRWSETNDHGLDRAKEVENDPYAWARLVKATMPNMKVMEYLIREFNMRSFTYPEDAPDAFRGLASSLSATSFADGFLWGLPLIFLDIFLLWQPQTTLERRRPKRLVHIQAQSPSWSWLGWYGRLALITYSKDDNYNPGISPMEATVTPICEWRTHETPYSSGALLPDSWHKYRTKYLVEDQCPPVGWMRHEQVHARGRTYTHHQNPNEHRRYPLPTAQVEGKSKEPSFARFLSCRTKRLFLYLGEARIHLASNVTTWYRCLRDEKGRWAGMIKMHLDSDYEGFDMNIDLAEHSVPILETREFAAKIVGNHSARAIELVTISAGGISEVDGPRMGHLYALPEMKYAFPEMKNPERPRGAGRYEFYNVLCIRRDGNIAYREGVGRVLRESWDQQSAEEIDLMLG